MPRDVLLAAAWTAGVLCAWLLLAFATAAAICGTANRIKHRR